VTEPTIASTQAIATAEFPAPGQPVARRLRERDGVTGLVTGTTIAVRTVRPGVPRRRVARSAAPAVSYALLSPGLLVVVTMSAGVTVTGWHLAGAEARRITESIGGMPVTGLQFTGLRLGAAERQTILIALAADHGGSDFEAAVLASVSS